MAGKRKTSKYAMFVKDYCKKNKGQKDLFKHAAKAWKSRKQTGGGEPMPLDSESSVAANAGPSTGGSRRSRRRGGSRRSRQSRRSRR